MVNSNENLIGLDHRMVMPSFRTKGGDILFYAAVALFIVSVVAYGGLFVYQGILKRQIADLDGQIDKKQQSLSPNLVQPLISLNDKIVSAKEILNNHLMPLNVFSVLSKNTLPTVSFSSFSYSAETRQVSLAASAANYAALADQIGVFESLPDFDNVDFGGLSLDPNGLVGFRLVITFKPDFLLKRTVPGT